jgi:hypothetical protein
LPRDLGHGEPSDDASELVENPERMILAQQATAG